MESLPADATVVNAITQYSVANPRIIGLLEASNRNENFVISDANENKYIFRRYRRNADKSRAVFQLKLQQHLLDNNFPTSEIVKTISNEPILTVGDALWVLFTFVDGREYDFSRLEQAAEAGRRLAQFHNILLTFYEEPVYLDFNPPQRDVLLKSVTNLAELEGMFSNQGVDEELSGCRWWWGKLLEELPLDVFDRLPSGLIHRDYHGRNVVFVEDEMRGLFDFDVLTEGPFAYDIAYGIHMFGREYRGSRNIRPEFAHSFLDEYSNIRPVIRDEIEAIPSFLFLAYLPEAAYYAYRKHDGDNVREMLIRDTRILPDVEAESEQLHSILAGI